MSYKASDLLELLVYEEGSDHAERIWNESASALASRLVVPEVSGEDLWEQRHARGPLHSLVQSPAWHGPRRQHPRWCSTRPSALP